MAHQYEVRMRTAIRVLTAIMDFQQPDSADVAVLQALAPECAGYPLDDLACEIIQRASIERRSLRERYQVA